MNPRIKAWAPWMAWLLLAIPAIAHLVLMTMAIGNRYTYPYDLEWMEGGLLQHAQRIADGDGLYGAPSVDFVPYLYTPLYPGLLAMLGSMFGISYQLGRAISILSLLGIGVLTLSIIRGGARDAIAPVRAAALGGALIALGLFAASYPYVEGWYDLVRADTLFLFMATGGLVLAHRTARVGEGWAGQGRTAAAAALLALSFFCKQTGIVFVAAGGVIVLASNWRRVPIYVVVSGAIGLGGTAILQRATGGWFWTYIREVHGAHHTNADRFWLSFEQILGRYPVMTAIVAIGLIVVAITAIMRRQVPAPARTFLLWTFVFAVSTLLGAISWATEFARFNAYIPALLHGAIAAGAALPALAACAMVLLERSAAPVAPMVFAESAPADKTTPMPSGLPVEAPPPPVTPSVPPPPRRIALLVGQAAAAVAAIALGVQLHDAWWSPRKWIPRQSDRAAGDALIARMAAVEGEIWAPSHPWYPHLAGKRSYVHRIGVIDVSSRQLREGPVRPPVVGLVESIRARLAAPPGSYRARAVLGLDEALDRHQFAAIFLDNKDLHLYGELPALTRNYHEQDQLQPVGPKTISGAVVGPKWVWVPIGPARRPPGATVLFDFEPAEGDSGAGTAWSGGWVATGTAWGASPTTHALPGQAPIRRAGGHRWVSSMHGDEVATGTLTSPEIVLAGNQLSMRLGGGVDPTLRVEIVVDGKVFAQVSKPSPPSERFSEVTIDISAVRDRTARLRMVDDSKGPAWGHLNVDEIWLHDGH